MRKGAGLVTFAPDGGVTLNKPTGIRPNRPMGAMVRKASDQTGANFTGGVNLAWDQEVYDTDSFHDNVTNNTRLTTPSKASAVTVAARIKLANLTGDMWVSLAGPRTGSTTYDGVPGLTVESGLAGPVVSFCSAPIPVTGGTDYFEASLTVETDTSVDITATLSWFAIDVTKINPVGCIDYQYGMVWLEKIGTDEWNIYGPALG